MKHLAKIISAGESSNALQFRARHYGKNGVREFLRDVIALANASVAGQRYIVVGVDDSNPAKRIFNDVPAEDFRQQPGLQALVNQFVEPPIRLNYTAVSLSGKRVGVIELGDCQDRPYMMRIDHSETLRRGDAYVRINDGAMKMGRRQLQVLFEKKFQEAVSGTSIEVGFAGEIIHKEQQLNTFNLHELPSSVASEKLRQLIKIRDRARLKGSTSLVARLTHARLFGSDNPYEHRTPEELKEEMDVIKSQYVDQDEQFLFEEHGEELQMVIYNQGEEPIVDASLSIVMPNHAEFFVADQLPKIYRNENFHARPENEQSRYPAVVLSDEAVQVSANLGDIPPGEVVRTFSTPLRICAGEKLRGKRFGLQYALFAQNLRKPAKGKLRLLF